MLRFVTLAAFVTALVWSAAAPATLRRSSEIAPPAPPRAVAELSRPAKPSADNASDRRGAIAAADRALFWEYNPRTRILRVTSAAGPDEMVRITLGAASSGNHILTILRTETAPLGDLANADWSVAVENRSGGDEFAPLYIKAVDNGDPEATLNYTGGGHRYKVDGVARPTAMLKSWTVSAAGVPLSERGGSGYATELDIDTTDDVMAFNTVRYGRYVYTEHFQSKITPGSIETLYTGTAKEPIVIMQYYGPEMKTVPDTRPGHAASSGYDRHLRFWGGNKLRADAPTFAIDAANGVREGRGPDDHTVPPIIVARGTAGIRAIWIDDGFGLGAQANTYVAPRRSRAFEAKTTKCYGSLIKGTQVPLGAGQSITARYGHAWAAAAMAADGVEAAFRRTLAGTVQYLGLLPAAGRGMIVPLPEDVGKTARVDGGPPQTVEAAGIPVSSTGYHLALVTIR